MLIFFFFVCVIVIYSLCWKKNSRSAEGFLIFNQINVHFFFHQNLFHFLNLFNHLGDLICKDLIYKKSHKLLRQLNQTICCHWRILTCLAVSAIKSSSFATTFKSGLRRYLGTRTFVQARFWSRAYVATSSCNKTNWNSQEKSTSPMRLLFYRSSKSKYRLIITFQR